MSPDLEYIKQVGIGAAYKGAEALRPFFRRTFDIKKKGAIDLVTEADLASEKAIIDVLNYRFPDHGIVAEESGRSDKPSPVKWIIDPLDGTTNFAHGLGLFAVSIACAIDDEVVAGVVLSPETGELFCAVKGGPAELNGRPISVSTTPDLADSLLVTGFPYDFKNDLAALIARFERCLCAAQGIRRLGAAALDLCYVACGRFEGFWETNLKPWDTAAGMLIARAAGAMVTDFSGAAFEPEKKTLLATNGLIHNDLLAIINSTEK